MRIGLLNLEPKYKNLALEKIRLYHSQQGDFVEDYGSSGLPLYDKVYCSSIFKFTNKEGRIPPGAICGGSGFDLTTTLPPEIDSMKPKLNFGFTSRGCIRRCEFCIVPEKEGKVRATGDLLDLWDGKEKLITLYDNNILALPKHFEKICQQSIELGLTLDFNQGLDHRLLNADNVRWLKKISHVEYHFAFDKPSYVGSVKRAIKLLKAEGINRSTWYVLVGFDTTFREDLFRLQFLKWHNQNAFVQKFKKKREYTPLARWANTHSWFHGVTFKQFLARPENKAYRNLGNQ